MGNEKTDPRTAGSRWPLATPLALLALAAWALPACGSTDESVPQHVAGGGAGGGTGGSGGEPVDPPPPPPDDWCQRVVPGPGGTNDFPVDLSAAHAWVRFFGTMPTHQEVDAALAAALGGDDPWSADALAAYADSLGEACALAADDTELSPASVEVVDGVAVIRPGTGGVELPAGVTAAIIDVRELPAVPDLREALESAASSVLDSEVARPLLYARQHDGMTDEVLGPSSGFTNVYSHDLAVLEQDPMPGNATSTLPVAVLTDAELAPEAAQFAGTLRMAARAWLVGEDVLASVAEARWHGVGQQGLLHRDRMLSQPAFWPDVIPADRRSATPLEHAQELLTQGSPPDIDSTSMSRTLTVNFSEELEVQADEQGIGEARAALIVAHGAARLFFPYFEIVGDTIDAGLTEELSRLASSTDTEQFLVQNSLSRFTVHLHDFHSWVSYFGAKSGQYVGRVPVLLDETEQGDVVVRRSQLANVLPGDRLLAVGGQPVADLIAELEELIASSTPGARRYWALYLLGHLEADTSWELAEPGVGTKTVAVTGADTVNDDSLDVFQECSRTAGHLSDLGHPELYYVNLDAEAYDGTPSAEQLATDAQGAAGLIVDARGYPGTMETWELIERLLETATTVRFDIPQLNPLESYTLHETAIWAPAPGAHYGGPVAVLMGPTSYSQAEYILQPLVSTDRATFVGRQTAGANGNVTGVMTPGAMGVTFGGMEVLFDDGSTFHGVGILPDVEVYPTSAELAAGVDPELEAAIALLAP